MSPPVDNLVRIPHAPSLASDDCRLFVESVADYAMFLLSTEGHVATWNRGAETIMGYAVQEIVGQHFSRFYPPEDRAAGKPEQELRTARDFGRVEDEGWRLRKDGTRFWANTIITAIRGESGELRGFGKVTRDLTAKRMADEKLRRSEQELRRSEERFRLLVENIGDYAIYLLDVEGRVSTWNVGAERMKGYAASEIIGRNFAVFFPPEDIAQGKPARELEAARASGRFEDEGWRVRKDGTRFWANAIVTALRDGSGKLLGFAKITRDLTVRRETEEKGRELAREQAARAAAEEGERRVRESEERYRALSDRLSVIFEGVGDVIMAHDSTGRVVFANSMAVRLFGFESREVILRGPGDPISERFDVFDEADLPLPPSRRPMTRVLGGAESGSAVLHLRDRSSGEERWVFARASKVSGGGGEPDLVITIWHDVTAERRQERHARLLAEATAALSGSLDEAQMLQALASALVPALGDWCSVALLREGELEPAALVHVDADRRVSAARLERELLAAREREFGPWHVARTGEAQVLNVTDELISSLFAGPARDRAVTGAALFAPVMLRGQLIGVMTFFRENRALGYDPSHVALVGTLGERAGTAIESARLYAEAQGAAKRAEEASRAKDEFLATVSHELRTPLSSILGWAQLLKNRVTDPALVKPIDVIHRNANAQVKIIDDILDVSRVITGKFQVEPRPTDLVPVVRDALEVVRPSALAKQIELQFKPEREFVLLVADPERLQQVVWNLLSNAVKFTPTGGKVVVTLRHDDSQVVLSITDTGTGIDPAFLPFVFDRFRQADGSPTRRIGGLGLGLSIVKHVVELHGGTVAAASEGLGAGSTFTITLPIRTPDMPSVIPLPAVSAATSGISCLKILVVDDDEDARAATGAALTERGAMIEQAATAEQAFGAFRSFRPDVLVSDIGMPGEDGYSLIGRIRALPVREGGTTPAIALTAFVRAGDAAKATAAGYTKHVGKPVDHEVLSSLIAELAGRNC
ncbi:MAG TPA: PAS domain S-box protein [Polyangiaceae bacterium]